MIFRALDSNLDWTFGQGKTNYLQTNLAISANIATRLRSFLNNCFFDMNAGIDWITFLGTPGTQEELGLRIKALILLSYGVINCTDVSVDLNRGSRQATITYTINTIYSSNYQQNIQVENYS